METKRTGDRPNPNRHQVAPLVIGKLLNIGGMLERHGNRLLRSFGVNQQQFSVLFEIAKAHSVNQTEMVNRLVLEKAHVSKIVKKLNEMGLVTVTTSPEDRRATLLEPTSSGDQLIRECETVFERWNREWIEEFDEVELESIVNHLTHLQAVFRGKT